MYFKSREIKNTGASTRGLADLTMSKMNKTEVYLREMSNSAKTKLWEAIDAKSELQKILQARKDLYKSLDESSNRRKEEVKKAEEEKNSKKAARAEKKAIKRNIGEIGTITPRKTFPRRKKAIFPDNS